MRAHIFVVDQNTFPIHRDRCFSGIGHTQREFDTYEDFVKAMLSKGGSGYRGMIADILGTRPGDLVFFYETGVGFHGIYQIAGSPVFDNTPIHGVGQFEDQYVQRNICLRVRIHCKYYFPKPVPEDMLFATPERETRFWVWFYRKIQIRGARGCTAMDPDAAQVLTELLIRINGEVADVPPSEPYSTHSKTQLVLPLGGGPAVSYEDLLRGWLVQNIDDPHRHDVRTIFGLQQDLEWFANNVPYHVAGRNIDVLAFHSTSQYFGTPIRYKFSVVELKRNRAVAKDIDQLIGYSRWVVSRLAQSETETVKPILIAHSFHSQAVTRAYYSDWDILLIEYRVRNNDITLHQIHPEM